MIACFDTSALVPLVLQEPGTATARRAWTAATRRIVAAVTTAELHAALAAACRSGRFDLAVLQRARASADRILDACEHRVVDRGLAQFGAALATEHSLRGYDAIQCAVALELRSVGAVGVAGDRALLTAWRAGGLRVLDVAASGRIDG